MISAALPVLPSAAAQWRPGDDQGGRIKLEK
jgi:hypothetical protein